MSALSWLSPRVQPSWATTRVLWAFCGFATWIPRGRFIPEAYSDAGIVLPTAFVKLSPLSLEAAWAHYAVLLLGLLLVAVGRWNRLGILLVLVPSSLLILHESINIKAYDRLFFWQGLVMLSAPGGGRGDVPGSPFARCWLLLVYCGLYGSTGWNKILSEPSWWTGKPLAYILLDPNFGMLPLGIWLSDKKILLRGMAVWTLLFEAGFPLLVWFRRLRPWLLLAGVCLHLGIMATLYVNTFSLVAIAAYPVLLGEAAWAELVGRVRGLVGGRGVLGRGEGVRAEGAPGAAREGSHLGNIR